MRAFREYGTQAAHRPDFDAERPRVVGSLLYRKRNVVVSGIHTMPMAARGQNAGSSSQMGANLGSPIGKTILGGFVLTRSELVLGLPDYEINDIQIQEGGIRISARFKGVRSCPHCGGQRLRNKGRYERRVRHEN